MKKSETFCLPVVYSLVEDVLSVYELNNRKWNIRYMSGRFRSIDHWACVVERGLMEVGVEALLKELIPTSLYKLGLELRIGQN